MPPTAPQASLGDAPACPADRLRMTPLDRAPVGALVRLAEARLDEPTAVALQAMGLTLDERLLIRQTGEPTIVSLSGGERRIGLARQLARRIIVAMDA